MSAPADQELSPASRPEPAAGPRILDALRQIGGFLSRHAAFAVLSVVAVALAVAQIRTLTYASGTDVMTYVRAANDLLAGDWPGSGGFPYAPLQPVLLATAVAVGGPFAPYWANVFLLFGTCYFLLRTLETLLGDRRRAALVVLGTLAGLAGFYGHGLHFLLMPFRETAALFFVGAGHWMLAQSVLGIRGGAWKPLLAGTCALLATGAREPSLLAFVGPYVFLCAHPAVPGRRRLRQAFWFVLPFLLAGGLVLLTERGRQLLVNQQAQRWLAYSWEALRERWGTQGIRSCRFLLQMLSWSGLAAFAWGLACAVFARRGSLLLFYGASAGLFFAFYAHMEAHYRYLLTVEWFMLPAMAYGLAVLVRGAERLARPADRVPGLAHAGLIVVILAWLAFSLSRLQPMGTATSAGQIRAMRETLDRLPSDVGSIALTDASRYALDAITSFTGHRIEDAATMEDGPLRGGPRAVVVSRNEAACFAGGYFPYRGLSADRILDQYADVSPLPSASGEPSIFWLGEGLYEVMMARPWEARTREIALNPDRIVAGLLWLDFRDSNPAANRRAEWRDAEGASLRSMELPPGNGLVPIRADSDLRARASTLLVESSDPLPRDLLETPDAKAERGYWWLEAGRRLSFRQWIARPARRGDVHQTWVGAFETEGAFRLPNPVGLSSGTLMLSVVLESKHKQDASVVFTYSAPGRPSWGFTNTLVRRRLYHDLYLDAPFSEKWIDLRVRVEPALPGNHYRVVGIGMGVREEAE